MIVFREEYVVYTTHIIYEYGIFQGIKCCNIIYPKIVRRTGHKWIGRKISHSLPWYLSNRSQLYKCFWTSISQQQTFLISGTHYICRYQSVSLFTETVHEILYQGSSFVLEMWHSRVKLEPVTFMYELSWMARN